MELEDRRNIWMTVKWLTNHGHHRLADELYAALTGQRAEPVLPGERPQAVQAWAHTLHDLY